MEGIGKVKFIILFYLIFTDIITRIRKNEKCFFGM